MLQFDDSCYRDAKQYHLASFSTRNSTLNTPLRKPIRMQDFIQLCDSTVYTVEFRFFEPPRETKIGSKNRRVQEIGGKIAVFD